MKKRNHLSAEVLATVLCLCVLVAAPAARAQSCAAMVTHEALSIGDIWYAPYVHMFYEDGIPVYTDMYNNGVGTVYDNCAVGVSPYPEYGSGNVMWMEEATNRYVIGALGLAVDRVTFQALSADQLINIGANGYPRYVGALDTIDGVALAPGVVVSSVTTYLGSMVMADVTVMGDIHGLIFGGGQASLDQLCVVGHEVPAPNCDHLADHESLTTGDAWGGSHGDPVGSLMFTENDVEAFTQLYASPGGGPLYEEAVVINDILPAIEHHGLLLDRIGVRYSVTALGEGVQQVSFAYAENMASGASENLRVGGLLYVGELTAIPSNYFPGFTVDVTSVVMPPFRWGLLRLIGNIPQFVVGGDGLYVDNVCFLMGGTTDVQARAPETQSAEPTIFPNPFNPRTSISFQLDRGGRASLRVHDAAGRLVRTLIDGAQLQAGAHQFIWDGRDDTGRSVATGTYFVSLAAGAETTTSKVMLIK